MRRIAIALFALAVLLTAASATTPRTGKLEITVLDSGGAPLAGATVTVIHIDGRVGPTSAITDASGKAVFPALPIGSGYLVEVRAPGFGTRVLEELHVDADATSTLSVRLAREVQEQITVTSAPGIVAESRGRFGEIAMTAGAEVGAVSRTFVIDVPAPPPVPPAERPGTEDYDPIDDNAFRNVATEPLSTFSADVDSASYSNVRRILNQGQLPPPGAVRIEELINYFRYDDPAPQGADPFAVSVEIAETPWNPAHRLARIGIQTSAIGAGERPRANLVFLLDVSGSMQPPDKLPLLKSAMKMLVETLRSDDRVAIVVYAGAAGLVLPSTPASHAATIVEAIDRLEAGGSTAGGAGIELAYATAADAFVKGGINRVILATDGDFNVGISDRSSLARMIESKARSGVFLTVLGFGSGNLKDSALEQLADRGNGNYAYVDGPLEARRVLVEEVGATLVTVAKDVKLQVEFNPERVAAYRLIGYENRLLATRDFDDDTKDAGEIGAGHSVTALYELVPAGIDDADTPPIELRYRPAAAAGRAAEPAAATVSNETMTVKVRYKEPDGDTSRLLTFPVVDDGLTLAGASDDLRWAAAVAEFGMLLRDSEHAGVATIEQVERLADSARGRDVGGYRTEFLGLLRAGAPLLAARSAGD